MAQERHPSLTLRLAGIYNVLWGAWVILFPMALFDFAELPRPQYPEIWQCVGMIVGVYGVGYWIAGNDVDQHWVIVLVGFLGKVFGPIGLVQALVTGVFNWKFALVSVFNDLMWWIPFFLILRGVYQRSRRPDAT